MGESAVWFIFHGKPMSSLKSVLKSIMILTDVLNIINIKIQDIIIMAETEAIAI